MIRQSSTSFVVTFHLNWQTIFFNFVWPKKIALARWLSFCNVWQSVILFLEFSLKCTKMVANKIRKTFTEKQTIRWLSRQIFQTRYVQPLFYQYFCASVKTRTCFNGSFNNSLAHLTLSRKWWSKTKQIHRCFIFLWKDTI